MKEFNLLKYFLKEYPGLVQLMKDTSHHSEGVVTPYHLEDDVFAHTLLVYKDALRQNNKITALTGLLHDIGKVAVKTEMNKRAAFIGHEGVSFFFSIEILNNLCKIGYINRQEMEQVLSIISLHGILFDYISNDKKTMKNPDKLFSKFKDVEYFNNFIKQLKNDTLGRFTLLDNEFAKLLGLSLYTEKQFVAYNNFRKEIETPQLKTRELIMLVGLPGSGKTTYLKNFVNVNVISYHDTLMEVAGKYNKAPLDYIKACDYSEYCGLEREIGKKIIQDYHSFIKNDDRDIVIDMINLTPSSREAWINNLPSNFSKKAIIFAKSLNTVSKQNKQRIDDNIDSFSKEFIPELCAKFIIPTYDEVDSIQWVHED